MIPWKMFKDGAGQHSPAQDRQVKHEFEGACVLQYVRFYPFFLSIKNVMFQVL